nr:hypothetical protein [Tanacetum cinerariifolium]
MVAILEKSDAAKGFEQIIDFLSGSYINHALTAVVKRSGDVTRLQALVDKKRIVITEEVIREILVDMDQDEGIELVVDHEKDAEVEGMHADKQAEIYNIDLDHSSKVLSMQEDDTEVAAASTPIPAAKPKTLTITAAPAVSTRRRKGVSREEMKKENEEIIISINKTPAQKAAKRRKLSEEAQEADNLRKRLEIVQDEDDDVFVKATPLAQKVPVVDYQIVVIDNKPKYKIIRADDTHQFYISFTTLLKNFDREDQETLWRIVKDRFSTSKPTNFSDEYLLLTLKTMFGELDEQDAIWRNQKSVHGLALTNVADLSKHTNRYISPLLTQKVFTNMRRVRKGFSGVETPLFETMLAVRDIAKEAAAQVPAQGDDVHKHVAEEVATDVVQPTPTSPLPSSPVIPSTPPHQSPCPPQPQDAEGSSPLFQQVLDTCSALAYRVKGLKNANAAQQLEIVKLQARVKKLEKLNKGRINVDMDQDEGIELVVDHEKDAEVEGRHADKQAEIYNIDLDHSSKVLSMQEDDTEVVAASTRIPTANPKILKIAAALVVSTRRRKRVVIRDPEEELHTDTLAETPTVKDKGKGILIEDPKPIKKKDQVEMDAEYAKKLQEELDKEHEEAYK